MHSNGLKLPLRLPPSPTPILISILILSSSPLAQVLGDALKDAAPFAANGGATPSGTRPRPTSLVQLETSSFELVVNSYNFETNTYTNLQERYSGQQERGRVRLTTRGIEAKGLVDRRLERTQVYFVDTRLKSSIERDELTNECKTTDWNTVLAHLGLDLIEFESNVSGHLFGAARLLRYFTVHRSQLRADISGAHYFTRGGLKSVRYLNRFVRERPRATGSAGPANDSTEEIIVLEVSVFYTEASLAGTTDWAHALPTRIQCEYPHEQRKGFVIEFGPLKFTDGDDLSEPNANRQLDVLTDGLAMEPATGCSQAIKMRHKMLWAELLDSGRPIRSFSFRVEGRHRTANFVSHHTSNFWARVAFDGQLKKLRVDMRTDALDETIQITDLLLDKTTHILAAPKSSSFMASFLEDPQTEPDRGSRLESLNSNQVEFPQKRPSSEPMFRCVNGEVSSQPLTAPTMSLDNLLLGGSQNYAYLGVARVRGIRARVYEATNTQLPFWLDPQVHTAASADRFRSPGQKRQTITVIYMSEPGREMAPARLLLVEIYEMDKDLKTTFNKRELSVFDFGWNAQAMGGSDSSGAHQAVGLFSLMELCAEAWRSASGRDQAEAESHAKFQMILRSDQQVASETFAWLRGNPSALQLGVLNSIQLDLYLVLGLVYDFETRIVGAEEMRPARDTGTFSLVVNFNVGRIPERLHKMMFLGRGRRVANKSWHFRVVSLQECFMLASHRQTEVEFAYDETNSNCYIATNSNRSTNINSQPNQDGPFQMDSRAPINVFRTLKVTDYHKRTREWWLNEPEVSSRRRRGLALDLGGQAGRIKMHIDHIRIREHNPHLLYGSSQLADRAEVILGVGLSRQDQLNWPARVESHLGDGSSEERLTLGQCQSLCEADFNCRSYSFCFHGFQAECLLSKANLNEAKLLSEVRLFILNKTSPSRRFKLGSDQSVTMKKSRNCAIYNKRYLNYYTESSSDSLDQVLYQRVLPAAELEQCAELCFRQLLDSRHHMASDKFAHHWTPHYDIFDRGNEIAESDDDDAEGCSKFYFVDVADQDQNEVRNKFELPPESQLSSGLCLLTASIASSGLMLKWAKLDPDKVLSYGMKFSQLYDEQYQVSLRRSSLSESEMTAIQNVIQAGLKREAVETEQSEVARQVLSRNENLQMVTFVDREICARLCYTQSSGLWPYCSSFDVIVSHHADVGPRFRCVLNSATKWQLLESGRDGLIDSSHWTGQNSSEERWHYEMKDGFVTHRRRHWMGVGDNEGRNQTKSGQTETSHSVLMAFSLYVAVAIGFILGIILMELSGESTERRRRTSATSQIELFDDQQVKPINS